MRRNVDNNCAALCVNQRRNCVASDTHNRHTLLLEYIVDELTHRTSVIHDELNDSTTRHVGVVVDASVLVHHTSSAIDSINSDVVSTGAVHVVRSSSEDGLEKSVEHVID